MENEKAILRIPRQHRTRLDVVSVVRVPLTLELEAIANAVREQMPFHDLRRNARIRDSLVNQVPGCAKVRLLSQPLTTMSHLLDQTGNAFTCSAQVNAARLNAASGTM